MKKRILFAFLSISCSAFLLPVQSAKPVTIVDYYKSIPVMSEIERKQSRVNGKIDLTVRDGKWVRSEFTYGCSDPLVDVQNGYMEFVCTGGSSSKTQYVLFLKEDLTPVIGVSVDSHDGACKEDSVVGFYENIKGNWTDVTSRVMPKMDFTVLLNKNYDKKKINESVFAVIKKYMKLSYDLPRYGLKVKIDFTTYYHPRCNSITLNSLEQSILDDPKGFLKGSFRNREMEWDPKTGIFKLLN